MLETLPGRFEDRHEEEEVWLRTRTLSSESGIVGMGVAYQQRQVPDKLVEGTRRGGEEARVRTRRDQLASG
jgi:hypothetical protein